MIGAALSFAVLLPLTASRLVSQQPSDADGSLPAAAADIHQQPLRADGREVSRWSVDDADVTWLRGDCRMMHGGKTVHSDELLIVVDGPPGQLRCRVVIAGVTDGRGHRGPPISTTVFTTVEPEVQAPRFTKPPESIPPLMRHLSANSDSDSSAVRQAQFTLNPPSLVPPPGTQFPGNGGASPRSGTSTPQGLPQITSGDGQFRFFLGGGTRSVEIVSRNPNAPLDVQSFNRTVVGETVVVARGGATVLVRDVTAQLPGGNLLDLGTVSLSADRIVAWLPPIGDFLGGRADVSNIEGELYLEGDIVFRQGDRVIYAESMYYNVTRETGMVLDAEAITTIPDYQGVVRLKADVLQQITAGNFRAFNAAFTTSRMGVPRYWLQSENLSLEQRPRLITDPLTGAQIQTSEPYVSSQSNFVYFGGVPVLYWPRFGTPLRRPTLYLRNANVRNDNIFGTQVLLEWDLFQLLGYDFAPEGIDSTIATDYLSERGPAFGSNTTYDLPGLFGIPGLVRGTYDSYLIYDEGLDTLGLDRRNLEPEETWRGRSRLQHRQRFGNGWEFIGEIGYLSDRNFLEQYFEEEWDQTKDHTTGLRLQRYAGSQLLDLSVQAQINDFYKETERLPVLEHYAIGLSPLGRALTWSMNNSVGYQKLNVAETPNNPIEAANFTTLPGEVDAEGLIATTQQELSVPLDLGALNVSPFIGGSASYFGEAVDGDSLTRLVGQAGVRASLPMYRIDPTIQSSLLNIRGLAHKVEWVGEYFYADSDTDLDELPYYDGLDDTPQEQFRRRFIFDQFGGVLPARFDPRLFGYRQGLQRYVTNPSDVIADDTQQVRLGVHQRFQTHRGLPGRDRIVDIFQFDVDTVLFPEQDRDNFGELVGPTTYDARFHLGDRVSLLSDGYIDFFEGGLRSISAGVRTSRPGLGDVYVGLISIEGPVSSTVLRSTLDYRLNEKWIANFGTTYDFSEVGNVGQTVGLKRIGESFLTGFEVNVDPGRDNLSASFYIVPRFFPNRRSRIGGQLIPPVGAEGLE